MRSKKHFGAFFLAALLACAIATPGTAQETNPKPPSPAAAAPHAYRLDYTLTESQGGKKIDSRQYSLYAGGEAQDRATGSVQIGTRVPVSTKADGTVDYLNVGTNIRATLSRRSDVELLDTFCEVSSLAPQDLRFPGHPVLRTLNISNSMPLVEGKPTVVGIADDPNSNQEFQLEVTVTELK